MDTVGEIIKYLLIFLGVMFLLLIIVLAVLWKMSPTHPWRLVLAAFARRVAATGGIALIDIPATAMQPLGDRVGYRKPNFSGLVLVQILSGRRRSGAAHAS